MLSRSLLECSRRVQGTAHWSIGMCVITIIIPHLLTTCNQCGLCNTGYALWRRRCVWCGSLQQIAAILLFVLLNLTFGILLAFKGIPDSLVFTSYFIQAIAGLAADNSILAVTSFIFFDLDYLPHVCAGDLSQYTKAGVGIGTAVVFPLYIAAIDCLRGLWQRYQAGTATTDSDTSISASIRALSARLYLLQSLPAIIYHLARLVSCTKFGDRQFLLSSPNTPCSDLNFIFLGFLFLTAIIGVTTTALFQSRLAVIDLSRRIIFAGLPSLMTTNASSSGGATLAVICLFILIQKPYTNQDTARKDKQGDALLIIISLALHASHGVMISIAFGIIAAIGIIAFLALPTNLAICINTPRSFQGLAEVAFDDKPGASVSR